MMMSLRETAKKRFTSVRATSMWLVSTLCVAQSTLWAEGEPVPASPTTLTAAIVVPPPVNSGPPAEATNTNNETPAPDDEHSDEQPRLKNPQRETGAGVRPGAVRPQMERPSPERPQVPRAERRLRGLMASFGFDDPEMQYS